MSFCRVRGFTLVELMVTVAVLAVLMAIGYPSFQSTLRSNRVATGSNELMAGFALARSEAIRNTRSSGLCPSSDGSSCGQDWSAGWLVWEDRDSDGLLGSGETVLRYSQGGGKLKVSSSQVLRFVFDGRGRVVAQGASGAALSGAQSLALQPNDCPSGQAFLRTLTISPTGQVRIARGNCT